MISAACPSSRPSVPVLSSRASARSKRRPGTQRKTCEALHRSKHRCALIFERAVAARSEPGRRPYGSRVSQDGSPGMTDWAFTPQLQTANAPQSHATRLVIPAKRPGFVIPGKRAEQAQTRDPAQDVRSASSLQTSLCTHFRARGRRALGAGETALWVPGLARWLARDDRLGFHASITNCKRSAESRHKTCHPGQASRFCHPGQARGASADPGPSARRAKRFIAPNIAVHSFSRARSPRARSRGDGPMGPGSRKMARPG